MIRTIITAITGGPRDWCVIGDATGVAHATRLWCPAPYERLVRSNMRHRAALRLARRLRQQAEDRPEAVL